MTVEVDSTVCEGDLPVLWNDSVFTAAGTKTTAIFASTGAAGFASNVRRDMYYNIQRFSFSNVDKFTTAGLVTRITRDITQVQMCFMMLY